MGKSNSEFGCFSGGRPALCPVLNRFGRMNVTLFIFLRSRGQL